LNYKKILIANDFSHASESAMALARFLFETCGASLDLVHVFNPNAFEIPMPYHFPAAGATWTGEHMLRLREQGEKALQEVAETVPGVQTHFLEGRPGPRVCEFAEENDNDLIILGSHGYGGLDRLFLGSVALYVSCHAPCTVMTVKPKDKKES